MRSRYVLLNDLDFDHHAPLVMVQQVAGKLEVARLGKRPSSSAVCPGAMSSISASRSSPFSSPSASSSSSAPSSASPPPLLDPAGSMTNSWTSWPSLPTAKMYVWPTWNVVSSGRTKYSPSMTPTQIASPAGVAPARRLG